MRIAVDARVLALAELRGIGSYVSEILAAWPDPDDVFLLFAPRPIPHEGLTGRARFSSVIVSEPRGSRVRVYDWFSLPRAMRTAGPDLIWSPANQAVPLAGVPQAVAIHDTLLQERVRHETLLDKLFHCALSPAFVRRYASRVICVSGFAAGRVSRIFNVEASRIRVIANGARLPARPFASRREAREYLAAKGLVDRPYALALGAGSPWKNSEGALRAFAKVSQAAPDIHFVLAGVQPEAKERLYALRDALGLADRLRIHGFVDRRSLEALYQGARVFVYPSLFEGFGLPPLEAMALSTPVAASNAASIPEVTGPAAELADASNPDALAAAILAILGDKARARELVLAGRRNIERFSWERSASAHRRLFTECLAR